MKPLAHLTIRVAWHDSQWNGSVCAQPGLSSFCAAMTRIRESKLPEEEKLAGRFFEKLSTEELPPCKADSGVFMSPRPWVREFDHRYRQNGFVLDQTLFVSEERRGQGQSMDYLRGVAEMIKALVA